MKLRKDWVVGFADGESSFVISITTSPHKTVPFTAAASFAIYAREDEKEIIESLQEFFGYGKVYYCNCKGQDRFKKTTIKPNNQYVFTINRIEDCLRLIPFFNENPLRTTKNEAFKKWTTCVKMINQGMHRTNQGLLKICKIRDGMNVHKGPYRDHYYFQRKIRIHARIKAMKEKEQKEKEIKREERSERILQKFQNEDCNHKMPASLLKELNGE